MLGGALGNLSDRIFRSPGFGRGGVVDWIHFAGGGGSLDLSDLAIQFGVLGAVIAMLADGRARKVREAPLGIIPFRFCAREPLTVRPPRQGRGRRAWRGPTRW